MKIIYALFSLGILFLFHAGSAQVDFGTKKIRSLFPKHLNSGNREREVYLTSCMKMLSGGFPVVGFFLVATKESRNFWKKQ
jgi:hypothetical protein